MKDMALVELGAWSGIQEQSTATGYREAWHRTLGWLRATRAGGDKGTWAAVCPVMHGSMNSYTYYKTQGSQLNF